MQRTNMSIAVVCMVNSTAIIELEMFDNNSMAVKEQNHHHCAVDPEMQRKSVCKYLFFGRFFILIIKFQPSFFLHF